MIEDKVTFAMLMMDWVNEHYPSIFVQRELPHSYVNWDSMCTLEFATGVVNSERSRPSVLGRIGLDAFYPWIYASLEEGQTLYAADPEFFEKLGSFLRRMHEWASDNKS